MQELKTPAQRLQVTACSVEPGCETRALTVVGTRGKPTRNNREVPPASERVNVSRGVQKALPFGRNVQKHTEASTGLFSFYFSRRIPAIHIKPHMKGDMTELVGNLQSASWLSASRRKIQTTQKCP